MSAHPGWWIHFWFNSIEYVHTLDGFNPPFSVLAYLQALGQAAMRSLVEQTWLAVLFALIFTLALMRRKGVAFTRPEAIAMSAVLITIPVKFLVFPLADGRFHFAYLIALALILITAYGRQREPLSFAVPEITPPVDDPPGSLVNLDRTGCAAAHKRLFRQRVSKQQVVPCVSMPSPLATIRRMMST